MALKKVPLRKLEDGIPNTALRFSMFILFHNNNNNEYIERNCSNILYFSNWSVFYYTSNNMWT